MQTIKNYLIFLLLNSLFTYSLPHSWITCTDYQLESNINKITSIEYNNNKCLGYPRNYNLQFQSDLNRGFGYDTGYNYKGQDCKYNYDTQYYNTMKMSKYKPGQQVCLTYPSKNHVASECTNNYVPDNGIKIYRSINKNSENELSNDFTKEYNHLNGIHQNGMIDYKGFQNCPGFCNNTDKTVCYVCFNLENEIESGIYSFKWIWEFNQNEYYSTCWDAEITNSNNSNNANNIDNTNKTDLIRNLSISNYRYMKDNICNADLINPPNDLTNPPNDLTNTPNDLTNPPNDLTNSPNDLTNPPNDLTNTPTDLINPPTDLTNPPTDLTNTPSIVPTHELNYNPNLISKKYCKEKGNELNEKKAKEIINTEKKELEFNNIGTANVWDQCGGNNMSDKKCINSKCIKYSPYYSQCLPDKLEKNALCGQNDNKEIIWIHNMCINGYSCKPQPGSMDFRCT
jgi:hypothetical protein